MSELIKNTAITSAGYVYQTRQGLKILCDWLDNPHRYQRVKFECDIEDEAPQALDDIVAVRSDGRIDLMQVKFTPNPDAHLLSWDWMLERSGRTNRSRSMLKKWFDAFNTLSVSSIGEIVLLTNRRPDAEIEACLVNNKFCLDKVTDETKKRLAEALGSLDACARFFSHLCVKHSDKNYERLEQEIESRLLPHGTLQGIFHLQKVAIDWAIRQNNPPPDGWIHLKDAQNILQAQPPAPLPENFYIPEGYCVPDEDFHQNFIAGLNEESQNVIVLSGPPGRGKSTYLSKVCEELSDRGVHCVRHHYYLSTTERGSDRIHSYAVVQSIQSQIRQIHPELDRGGDFRGLLEQCGRWCKARGTVFVLIIDGLDHVWRTNARDKRPLDDLFGQLLPCPENVVLIVGTQPVDDAQLPVELLVHAPRSGWLMLPAMSEYAIRLYLEKVVSQGRISTSGNDPGQQEAELAKSATALREKTNGHPLHVIYATEELIHAGGVLTAWRVNDLKGDLSKDARTYYASLWYGLPPSLKDVLRLISAFPFFWPDKAFPAIARASESAFPDIPAVAHLLYESPAGRKVFHESLAVFVRETDEFDARIQSLLPHVIHWIENSAPDSLRVNWLWSVQARAGSPDNLITGLTRDWVMSRIEEGFPETVFKTLLSDALEAALDTGRFADAYRIEHLSNRVLHRDSQIQSDNQARLQGYTLALTSLDSVLDEAYSSRHESNILEVAALGLALQFRDCQYQADQCGEEILHRLRMSCQSSQYYSTRAGREEFHYLLDVLSRLGFMSQEYINLLSFIEDNDRAVWMHPVRLIVESGEAGTLFELIMDIKDEGKRAILTDSYIRAFIYSNVDDTAWDGADGLVMTPFLATVQVLMGNNAHSPAQPVPITWMKGDYEEINERFTEYAHHWFFSSLYLSLSNYKAPEILFSFLPAEKVELYDRLHNYLDALTEVAQKVAEKWQAGARVGFEEIYELTGEALFYFGQYARQKYADRSERVFLSALHLIACDVFLIDSMRAGSVDPSLSAEALKKAQQSDWFSQGDFRYQYVRKMLVPLSENAATEYIQSERERFRDIADEETSVRLVMPLELCEIALRHGLLAYARELCIQVWELAVGYGHRKDHTLGMTLDGLEHLVSAAPDDAMRLLQTVAPQVHHVLDYTDGRGTRQVLEQADWLLAKLHTPALLAKYEEHALANEKWQAENSLRIHIKQGVENQMSLAELLKSAHLGIVMPHLIKLSEAGSEHATRLLHEVDPGGEGIPLVAESEATTDKTPVPVPFSINFADFGPADFDRLINNITGDYAVRNKILHEWYSYWQQKGHDRELVCSLTALQSGDQDNHAKELADDVILSCLKLRRTAEAWKLLVKAQITKGGWYGFFENSGQTHLRLDQVAKYYKKRCDEFVKLTTFSMFPHSDPKRIAPKDSMVYFLVKQGRVAEAVNFAEDMVKCVLEDTRTLQLSMPEWARALPVDI